MGAFQFHVEMVKKIDSVKDGLQFLLELERINRNSLKRILLDCPANIAQELLVSHVNNVHLGRRNFHYLMSSLVLEDEWDRSVVEYGAINVTGLRLVNPKADMTRRFFKR